jgi:DUF1365 family protein
MLATTTTTIQSIEKESAGRLLLLRAGREGTFWAGRVLGHRLRWMGIFWCARRVCVCVCVCARGENCFDVRHPIDYTTHTPAEKSSRFVNLFFLFT